VFYFVSRDIAVRAIPDLAGFQEVRQAVAGFARRKIDYWRPEKLFYFDKSRPGAGSSCLKGIKTGKTFVIKQEISTKSVKNIFSIIGIIFLFLFFYICFQIYVPINPGSNETISYAVQKGWGDTEIANNLQKLGIIKSAALFKFYALVTLQHSNLQAGQYNLSPKMSIYQIVKAMAEGDVVKDRIVIPEGWDITDIAGYLQSRDICKQDYFISLTKNPSTSSGQETLAEKFSFLLDKPKSADLEGYLFPDTYQINKDETCDQFLLAMLANFDKKLTPDLRTEIAVQKKTIFDIVTMASMIEKEVRTLSDKKIVSGILWKRLAIGMPLQLDSTIIYITGKTSISTKDKTINSPYNTYKYYGLPKGPISNPGIDSITAAIYPTKTNYWYYLTDGKTYFSETLDQHNAAKAKYLGY
jgi:UPF0755 protein